MGVQGLKGFHLVLLRRAADVHNHRSEHSEQRGITIEHFVIAKLGYSVSGIVFGSTSNLFELFDVLVVGRFVQVGTLAFLCNSNAISK